MFPFIILLPITIEVAPLSKASFGDITLFWSLYESSINLIPGEIIIKLLLVVDLNKNRSNILNIVFILYIKKYINIKRDFKY